MDEVRVVYVPFEDAVGCAPLHVCVLQLHGAVWTADGLDAVFLDARSDPGGHAVFACHGRVSACLRRDFVV